MFDFVAMESYYKDNMPDTLYMTHYDLAAVTDYSVEDWRTFLTTPDITEFVTKELSMLKETQLKKLLNAAGSKQGQLGTAQLISALARLDNNDKIKEGPVFIYNYITPDTNEAKADNVIVVKKDPFK